MTRSSRGVSRSRSTGDFPPGGLQLQVGGQRHGARVVGVRVGKPHALRIVDDDRQVRRHRLARRRDQHRLEQHGRDREQGQHAQADEQRPLAPRQLAALPAVEPPEQASERRSPQTIRMIEPAPRGQRRELEPGIAPRRRRRATTARSPGGFARIRFMSLRIRRKAIARRQRDGRPRLRRSTRRSAERTGRTPGRARSRGRSRRRDRTPSPARDGDLDVQRLEDCLQLGRRDPLERALARVGVGRVQSPAGCPADLRPRRDPVEAGLARVGDIDRDGRAAVARVLRRRGRPAAAAARRRRAESSRRWRPAGSSGRPAASARRP